MEAGGVHGGVMVFNMAGWQDGGIETIHMGPGRFMTFMTLLTF